MVSLGKATTKAAGGRKMGSRLHTAAAKMQETMSRNHTDTLPPGTMHVAGSGYAAHHGCLQLNALPPAPMVFKAPKQKGYGHTPMPPPTADERDMPRHAHKKRAAAAQLVQPRPRPQHPEHHRRPPQALVQARKVSGSAPHTRHTRHTQEL